METQTAFDLAWAARHGQQHMTRYGGEAMCVHRAGSGRPLVCIHGWAMGGRSFAEQLALIDHGFELIAPDLPGFGNSPVPSEPPTIASMAQGVRALIDALQLNDVILIGWSMGATIAWHLAAHASEGISALVSLDMTPRVAPEAGWDFALSSSLTAEALDQSVQAMRQDWIGYCDLFLDRIQSEPQDLTRAALAKLAAQADPLTASQAWLSLVHYDARAQLGRIGVPALAIQGGRSALYPQAVGHEIARRMPNCQAFVLEDVGHAPHLEDPATFHMHLLNLTKQGHLALDPCLPISAP